MGMIIVFAGTDWEAELIKSVLENEGIQGYLKDQFTGINFPWYTAPGGAGAIKVTVAEEDVERAKEIVHRYWTSIHPDNE